MARKTSGHQRELITTPDKILFKVHQLGETKVLQALQKRQITTRIEFQSRIPENRPREPRKKRGPSHILLWRGEKWGRSPPPRSENQEPPPSAPAPSRPLSSIPFFNLVDHTVNRRPLPFYIGVALSPGGKGGWCTT